MKARHAQLLVQTSRTFSIPILRAPPPLREAIGSAYLCMRAIDQVEDHDSLPAAAKSALLRGMARLLRSAQERIDAAAVRQLFQPHTAALDEVTLALVEVAEAAPEPTRRLVWSATADMAEDMADWADRGWHIGNEADLDAYTFSVAGRVGLLLSALWRWHDGTTCDEAESIGFGRALQAINILRNADADRQRGVDFYPPGWQRADMVRYASRQLELADRYMARLPPGAPRDFCAIPLALARATLLVVRAGREKLTRSEVEAITSAGPAA